MNVYYFVKFIRKDYTDILQNVYKRKRFPGIITMQRKQG